MSNRSIRSPKQRAHAATIAVKDFQAQQAKAAVPSATSWWCGTTREQFTAEVIRQQDRMNASRPLYAPKESW